MFSDKKFNLPNKLIEASRLVMEEKELDSLYSKFNDYLEENYHVDQLTEEEIAFIFEEGFLDWLTGSKKPEEKQNSTPIKQPTQMKANDVEMGMAQKPDPIALSAARSSTPLVKDSKPIVGSGVTPGNVPTAARSTPASQAAPTGTEPPKPTAPVAPVTAKPPASAARPSAPQPQRRAPRPSSAPSGGSFSQYPSWAQKAFQGSGGA